MTSCIALSTSQMVVFYVFSPRVRRSVVYGAKVRGPGHEQA